MVLTVGGSHILISTKMGRAVEKLKKLCFTPSSVELLIIE